MRKVSFEVSVSVVGSSWRGHFFIEAEDSRLAGIEALNRPDVARAVESVRLERRRLGMAQMEPWVSLLSCVRREDGKEGARR